MLLSSLHGPDLEQAVTVGDSVLSRADLVEAATRLASALPHDGPVAVDATPSIETVVTVVACLLAGVPVVPVPPDSGSAEVAHMLADSRATVWVGSPRDDISLPRLDANAGGSGSHPLSVPSMDDVALILYTSGTTGAPKGVELAGRAIAAGLDGLIEAWAWTPDDTLVHGLPLFHTHGLILGVLGALRVGSRLVHTVRPRPEAYAAARGSMYFGVPTVWSRVTTDAATMDALRHARLLVSGSAPLPVSVFDRLAAGTGIAPIERYGMTETMITLSTRADGERRPGWVGLPVPGSQTRIRSETGADVPADGESIGRLEVRGPMLFAGYLGKPEATAASWTDDGWFMTGDIATRDVEGFHRLVGRESTDLIKSGGYRIGSGEIESVMLDHPAVDEVAVVGLPDTDLGQKIVAFVVADPAGGTPGLGAELIDLVATQLSWHKRPREVVFVERLPRNAMGKVQKKQLG